MASKRTAKKPGGRTRDQVLDAACKVFAAKGFRDARVAEICKQAGANVAAVNYYFGDKENLYVEAWREAFQRSVKAHPPDGGVDAQAPPAQRLRGRIRSLIRRVLDPGSDEFEIVRKELANPTGLLDEVLRECIGPMRQGMADVVRELLGPGVPELQVILCTRSIGSQCMHLLTHHRRSTKGRGGARGAAMAALDVDAEALADHVTRFSLAGIVEVRAAVERGELGGTE